MFIQLKNRLFNLDKVYIITQDEPKAIRVEINVGNNHLSYERIEFKTAEECTKEWERINKILTKAKEE